MKELEEDVGVGLLERPTRNTGLTYAGQVLLEECRRVMASCSWRVTWRALPTRVWAPMPT